MLADDFDEMRAAGLGHRPEACQAVAKYSGAQYQIELRPIRDRVIGKAFHLCQLDILRGAFVVERSGKDDRNLVLPSAARHTASALAI